MRTLITISGLLFIALLLVLPAKAAAKKVLAKIDISEQTMRIFVNGKVRHSWLYRQLVVAIELQLVRSNQRACISGIFLANITVLQCRTPCFSIRAMHSRNGRDQASGRACVSWMHTIAPEQCKAVV